MKFVLIKNILKEGDKMNIIVTAGGTSEQIDKVRKITNSSSGKLGSLIAHTICSTKDINKLYYICSKDSIKPNHQKIEVIDIVNTSDLELVMINLLTNIKIDYCIHSMAVSDYTVDYVSTANMLGQYIHKNLNNQDIKNLIINNTYKIQDDKISSYEDDLIIKLKKTKKIISMIKKISPDTKLFGFKLLDNVPEDILINKAIELMNKNKCDLVIANDLENIRRGNHKAFIIESSNKYEEANGKEDIAIKILKYIK